VKPPPPSLVGARVTPEAAARLLPVLAEMVPDPRCELDFRDPFELLIATQLSAQSTDAMVNKVTPTLFARWPDAFAMAEADPTEMEAILRPTGFFRQKSKNAIATARLLVERHGGAVPPRMEDIIQLPGAARKTANVVLGTAFGIQSGVTVDTHAFRVTHRWGWHDEKTPEKVEPILMALVPQTGWADFGHRAVLFGRHHCTARKPACGTCLLQDQCVAFRDGTDGAGLEPVRTQKAAGPGSPTVPPAPRGPRPKSPA
jgi:endonuclease-3